MKHEAYELMLARLGELGVRGPGDSLEEFERDWTGLYRGKCRWVTLPTSTEEVAFVVRTCARYKLPIVPQGGNTGLCAGAIPDDSGNQVILNLRRMNRIREVGPHVAVAEAGVILENLHREVESQERYFPLTLGAKGSCMLGGNIATNAGGLNVLRYGSMRQLVLGLEVVLPDGTVLDAMSPLHKDNTGYDLKQWFIGSEGTLGIITAASLKLFPLPKYRATAWLGVNQLDIVIELFTMLSRHGFEMLSRFELIADSALRASRRVLGDRAIRLERDYPWNLLFEFSTADPAAEPHARMTQALASAMESDLVEDGVIAESSEQRADMWKTRDSISEGQGPTLRHDVSVPTQNIPRFVDDLLIGLNRICPRVQPIIYGHVGDGNLHVNLPKAQLPRPDHAVSESIYAIVDDHRGSFSGEHGIGSLKRDAYQHHKSALARELMLRLKRELDPMGIMNPNAIF